MLSLLGEQGATDPVLHARHLAGSLTCREDYVVGTKVAGPGNMPWLRGGPTALDASAITEAIDRSLARLRCNYIDLYQLHWPDRCAAELYYP